MAKRKSTKDKQRLSGFYNVSLMTFPISENKNIQNVHRKHQF
jgi:hypothetical protein